MAVTGLPSDAVPQITEGTDFRALQLEPAEGFLLSRVDGSTDVRGICMVSGIGESQTHEVLLKLARTGVLEFRDRSGKILDLGEVLNGGEEIDESAPIAPELQIKIKKILAADEADDPYTLLGVEMGQKDREIKRAYLLLTQELHPDNFYGLEAGEWATMAEQAFAALTKAWESLSDPEQREAINRRLRQKKAEESSGSGYAGGQVDSKLRTSRKESVLYQRVRERVQKAREMAEEAERKMYEGDFLGAHASYKLATAYDPRNESYQRQLKLLEPKIRKVRADTNFRKALKKIETHDEETAIELLKEVVEIDSNNAAAFYELARLLLPQMSRGGPDAKRKVLDLAEAAAIRVSDNPDYLLLAAKVNEVLKNFDRAEELYRAVLKVDKKNEIAKRALKNY